MGRLRFAGIEVIPLGADAAFARGAWRLQMRDGKQPHGLFTLLLRRLDGSWRIVHDHTSSGE
jgi:ketosteroid isomerase-like protein